MLSACLFNFIVETKLRSTLNNLGKSIFEITLEDTWNGFFFIDQICVESGKKKIADSSFQIYFLFRVYS